MNKIELGMSKKQVSDIPGKTYTIAEKYTEAKDEIEVISYRNFPQDDEFYLFKSEMINSKDGIENCSQNMIDLQITKFFNNSSSDR